MRQKYKAPKPKENYFPEDVIPHQCSVEIPDDKPVVRGTFKFFSRFKKKYERLTPEEKKRFKDLTKGAK